MARETSFSTEDIIRGLQVLDSMEVESSTPCTHQYNGLFAQMAVERIAAQQQGEDAFRQYGEKYDNVFKEIAGCSSCPEEYVKAVRDARTS